jgi:predicted RNase H-like HicB family nuclease
MSAEQRWITLTENPDGWWTAHEEMVGLTAQGETRDDALNALDEVLEAVEEGAGRSPTDDELRELGIDPEDNETGGELPDVLK